MKSAIHLGSAAFTAILAVTAHDPALVMFAAVATGINIVAFWVTK